MSLFNYNSHFRIMIFSNFFPEIDIKFIFIFSTKKFELIASLHQILHIDFRRNIF